MEHLLLLKMVLYLLCLDGGVMNLGGAPVPSDEPAMVEPIPENIDVEDTSCV